MVGWLFCPCPSITTSCMVPSCVLSVRRGKLPPRCDLFCGCCCGPSVPVLQRLLLSFLLFFLSSMYFFLLFIIYFRFVARRPLTWSWGPLCRQLTATKMQSEITLMSPGGERLHFPPSHARLAPWMSRPHKCANLCFQIAHSRAFVWLMSLKADFKDTSQVFQVMYVHV